MQHQINPPGGTYCAQRWSERYQSKQQNNAAVGDEPLFKLKEPLPDQNSTQCNTTMGSRECNNQSETGQYQYPALFYTTVTHCTILALQHETSKSPRRAHTKHSSYSGGYTPVQFHNATLLQPKRINDSALTMERQHSSLPTIYDCMMTGSAPSSQRFICQVRIR